MAKLAYSKWGCAAILGGALLTAIEVYGAVSYLVSQNMPNYLVAGGAVVTIVAAVLPLLAARSWAQGRYILAILTWMAMVPALSVIICAAVVAHTLNTVANDFAVETNGWDDPFWLAAMRLLDKTFDRYGDLPDGLDPLQQRVAQVLIEKVRDNMRGLYPALTRLLIPTLGPYRQGPEINPRSAFGLLREAFYRELKRLPELRGSDPEHASRMLPRNARLDGSTLIHVYRRDEEHPTDLETLDIPEVSFTDAAVRLRRS